MKYLIIVLIFVYPLITKAQNYIPEKSIFLSGGLEIFQTPSSENIRAKYLRNILFQAGFDLEHKLFDSNFSVFGEAQYNHIRSDYLYYKDKFSGMNLTAGIRFYLQK